MSKDLLYTVLGILTAAATAGKEYLAVQSGAEDFGSWQFWVGMGTAIVVAALGYMTKKGE